VAAVRVATFAVMPRNASVLVFDVMQTPERHSERRREDAGSETLQTMQRR